jgi:hypothetical protein
MDTILRDPLIIYEELDPILLNLVNDTQKLALADGALPRKVKLLIAMFVAGRRTSYI